MTESQLKNKVMTYLKTVPGVYARKISDRYSSGYPDIWGHYRGFFFAIELKKIGGKLSDIQAYEFEKIQEAGGYACVCWGVKGVKLLLDTIESEAFND